MVERAQPLQVVDGGGPAPGERDAVVALQARLGVAALDDTAAVAYRQRAALVDVDVARRSGDRLDVDAVRDDEAQVGVALPRRHHRHR